MGVTVGRVFEQAVAVAGTLPFLACLSAFVRGMDVVKQRQFKTNLAWSLVGVTLVFMAAVALHLSLNVPLT